MQERWNGITLEQIPIHTLVLHFDYWFGSVEHEKGSPEDSIFARVPQGVSRLTLGLPHMAVAFPEDDAGDGRYAMCERRRLQLPPSLLAGLEVFEFHCDWTLRHITGPLAYCANLRSLTLDFRGQQLLYEPGGSVVEGLVRRGLELPSLRVLHLMNCASTSISLLKWLKAPVLVDLSVGYPAASGSGSTGSMTACLTVEDARRWWRPYVATRLKLQRLRMHTVRLEDGFLEATMIHSLPELTSLELTGVNTYPLTTFFTSCSTVCALHEHESQPDGQLSFWTFPKLRTLKLNGLEHDFQFDVAFSYLDARRNVLPNCLDMGSQETLRCLEGTYMVPSHHLGKLGFDIDHDRISAFRKLGIDVMISVVSLSF